MKQTAVEWLYEQLDVVDSSISYEYFKKAKEMEKKQIKDAYNIGFIHPIEFDFNTQKSVTAEQYYNETFKSE